MGMYTKVSLVLPIKRDIDENTKNIIYGIFKGYGINDLKEEGIQIPEHPFFKPGTRIWFPISVGSYYFTGTSNSAIKYDTIGTHSMVLHIDSDSKADYIDIENFLDWICPYIDFDYTSFIGYSLYEEYLNPTLYYYKDGEIVSYVTDYKGE